MSYVRQLYYTLLLIAACVLSSCYTNVNQLWFKGHREYVAYDFDYNTDEEADIYGLPPQLYRVGDAWYMGAVQCRLEHDYPYNCVQSMDEDFFTRHYFDIYPEAVYFHKITPELAHWMLHSDQESIKWFTKEKIEEELSKAGGTWTPTLPEGAENVPADFLKFSRRSLMIYELAKDTSPWYAYPMSALTFLCVDVPATAVGLAICPFYAIAVSFTRDPIGVAAEAFVSEAVDRSTPSRPKKSSSPRPTPTRRHAHHGDHSHHHAHTGNASQAPHSSRNGSHHSGGGAHHGHKNHSSGDSSDKKHSRNKQDSDS